MIQILRSLLDLHLLRNLSKAHRLIDNILSNYLKNLLLSQRSCFQTKRTILHFYAVAKCNFRDIKISMI